MKLYHYVGPAHLAEEARSSVLRLQPRSAQDISASALRAGRARAEFTFVVDADGELCLSDRRTEHVACARGRPVLAAGELALRFEADRVLVDSVTNQSTGYCPEPSCWPHVHAALTASGLVPPGSFTHAFDFRRCTSCRTINVLKDEVPECGCGAALPDHWNCDATL